VLLLSRHPQNFCKKELILDQRYLLHPDSDSTDFFFEIGYFFTKNIYLQLDFVDLAQKCIYMICKVAALETLQKIKKILHGLPKKVL